ncbi:hypothetical protein BDV95DRAFT_603030 [Massariosphaeria phaeospora]|uniref:Methyltransferase-domain-containing protein n=1 Tax=Massariosphaeria phaeospora TaxID=100035 RepID=A0A7C8IBN3_9PLEO|nr:hypothetical protein BDV95DRAFT_603030 [Massariosphaeria phaeospora]
MILPNLITTRHPPSRPESAEDIFSSTLGSIFPDDVQNLHGDDPATLLVYKNARFGDLELRTADVNGEEQRRKFAHYLWNAGILMAELVGGRGGGGVKNDTEGIIEKGEEQENGDGWKEGEWWVSRDEEKLWNVEGETVLELGAGVGLSGITSALAGAKEVVVTDYPAPPIIETIKLNIANNVLEHARTKISVHGHQWGDLSTEFAAANAGRYTRIFAADCLWMPHEHENLASSMLHFLSDSSDARIFCIAGFHTGRAKMAAFFEETVPKTGLEIEEIFEMDADGKRREWAGERDGGREDVSERKKWLAVARLRRRGTA